MTRHTIKQATNGFTLIEILLVVAALSILAGIVILAVNPTKQLGDTRNAQRVANVRTILDAVYQYAADNNGIPGTITTTVREVCASSGVNCAVPDNLTDLSILTTNEKYIVSMPMDPQCPTNCATYGTGYFISKTTNGRVEVSAPSAEQGETILQSR